MNLGGWSAGVWRCLDCTRPRNINHRWIVQKKRFAKVLNLAIEWNQYAVYRMKIKVGDV